MPMHACFNQSKVRPALKSVPEAINLCQQWFPHMPHLGTRVERWKDGDIRAHMNSMRGVCDKYIPLGFKGPVIIDIESLPLDDESEPWAVRTAEYIRAARPGCTVGLYSTYRFAEAMDFVAPALYGERKTPVLGWPWHSGEALWAYWFREWKPELRWAEESGKPIQVLFCIWGRHGRISSDVVRMILEFTSAWKPAGHIMWGVTDTPEEARIAESWIANAAQYIAYLDKLP